MTPHDTSAFIRWIKSWEGGFVNDPDDLGGATNQGITIATFRSVYGSRRTVEDLKALSSEQWEHIFRTRFYNRWKADEVADPSVAFFLVDWVWGSGAYGIREPQKLLGVDVDGIVGPQTLAAVNARDPHTLFAELKACKRAYLERICAARPANRKFLRGWNRRLDSICYGELITNRGERLFF